MILPGTTRTCSTEVIKNHNRGLLMNWCWSPGAAATLLQAVTPFAYRRFMGTDAQRSITEMRRASAEARRRRM